MTGRGRSGACPATRRSRPALRPPRRRDRTRRRHHLSRNARPARREAGPGAAREARAHARRGLHRLILPLHVRYGWPAVALVRAAAPRRCGTRGPDRQADDRDIRALRARGPRWLLRARHGGAARDEAVLFRAHPRLDRASARPLPAAGGNRSGLVETARPLLAPYLDLRPSKGARHLPAGRLCRLCTPPGFVRRPARPRDPAEDGTELAPALLWLGADGAMQRVRHKEEPILRRPVALGLPDRQFLRRQL